jgi:uncharacterized delta-60 repeat protein
MSILTKPSNPISANTDIQFELNLSELLTLVESITESSYWEDSSNWRVVDFIFTNSQKQYQRVVFKVNQNETSVTYRFSEDCINGLFECSRITVFGNVNDSLRIKRSSYGSQFDVIIEDGVEEVLAIDLTSMNVPTNDTYSDGDILDFTLNFSGLVNVEGLQILTENSEPILLEDGFSIVVEESRLVLTIGSNTRYANYYSGSSTSSVTYRYIVQADDQDLDGLEIVGLDLNGGDIVGVNGENVNLVLPNVDTSGIIINNVVIDTEQPTILSIDVLNGTYTNTDEIVFTLTFSEQISISGSPELLLDVGGVSKVASLVSSSSTQAVFSYIVGSTDNDADGISIISLDNGVIQDTALNLLDRTLPVVDTSNVLVFNDVTAPTIVSITANPGTYILGETLTFVVGFSENVIISNGGYLLVDIGGSVVQANYSSNDGFSVAYYSYTLSAGLLDTDGIEVLSFTYPHGTIQDYSGNFLDNTLPVIDTSNVFVDTVAPTITSVTPPVDGTYSEGQQLNFTVNFDDTVLVTGAPFLGLTIGSTVKQAEYVSGTGSSSLLFRYTVASGDEDTNGITFTSNSVQIPASTIRDAVGNNAILTFTAPSMTGVLVSSIVLFEESPYYTDVTFLKERQDGSILVGGRPVNGGNFVIYNSNGSIDNSWPYPYSGGSPSYIYSFSAGAALASADVRYIEIDTSANLYIGGMFQMFNGVVSESLVKFNSSEQFDNSFSINFNNYNNSTTINSIALEGSGDIIIGRGVASGAVDRIFPDGTGDFSFAANIGSGFNAGVLKVLIQSDGKIIAAGGFSTFKGLNRRRIVRLNPNGTEDTSFYSSLGTGFNNTIRDLFIQSDGKILVAGDFTSVSGQPYYGLARLNDDGSLDNSFNIGGSILTGSVYTVLQQSDNSIVIGGSFSYSAPSSISNIARFNLSGSYDTSFTLSLGSSPFNNLITCIRQDSSGRLLVGGYFTTFKGDNRNKIVRILTSGIEG